MKHRKMEGGKSVEIGWSGMDERAFVILCRWQAVLERKQEIK